MALDKLESIAFKLSLSFLVYLKKIPLTIL